MVEEVLKQSDLFGPLEWPKPLKVSVPALGKVAYIRILKAAEREECEAASYEVVDGEVRPLLTGSRGRLLALCLCDADGKRIFGDDDAKQLADKPTTIVEPLYEACCKANLIGPKAKEEAKKNSPTVPS